MNLRSVLTAVAASLGAGKVSAGRRRGVCLRAVHLALVKKHQGGLEPAAGSDVLEGFQDFLVSGVLLMQELVARESEQRPVSRARGPAAAGSSGRSPRPMRLRARPHSP